LQFNASRLNDFRRDSLFIVLSPNVRYDFCRYIWHHKL
jgi:hypothetical protein